MIENIKPQLGEERFQFFEGSKVLENVIGHDDAKQFKLLSAEQKTLIRNEAIKSIQQSCTNSQKIGVVTGHFSFWNDESKDVPEVVCTTGDLETYTHIFYLDVDANEIAARREKDEIRGRAALSVEHLEKWQESEKNQLRRLCYNNNILFTAVRDGDKLVQLIEDCSDHSIANNMAEAVMLLDGIVFLGEGKVKTMLLIDGDKTLAPEDTGELFWKSFSGMEPSLREVFGSSMGYSHTAFRQAMLLYEEAVNEEDFDKVCDEIAAQVNIWPEFERLLKSIAKEKHLGVVVVTCGLHLVWEKALTKAGLSDTVKIIGGGRLANGYVVTPEVKAGLVAHLQDEHNMFVWASGDSPVDLPMLKQADHAVVVVGNDQHRSKSMEAELKRAMAEQGLKARQMLLPSTAKPRLDGLMLPVVQPADIAVQVITGGPLLVMHATDRAATRLIATPTRNGNISGPELREAHGRVGYYLATEMLPSLLGLEPITISHVLGNPVTGFRMRHEAKTTIISLMRGGDPMALGVSKALPTAMYLHAHDASEVTNAYLDGQSTVLLVDFVVNEGNSTSEFVKHIRGLKPDMPIVILAGVVQKGAIGIDGSLSKLLEGVRGVSLIALRLSETKFTGSGTTDTGNRLFNTTHLVRDN